MTDENWHVGATGFDPETISETGNRYLIGNGYMGYRGTLGEYTAAQQVALNLAGVYDQHGTAWREPVNAPNPLYITLTAGKTPLSVLETTPVSHQVGLDLRRAVFARTTSFAVDAGTVTVTASRFVSGADRTLGAARYTVSSTVATPVTLTCGIDEQVWDINGPHLVDTTHYAITGGLVVTAVTGELERQVAVWQRQFLSGSDAAGTLQTTAHGLQMSYPLALTPGVPVTLTVLFGVGVDDDRAAMVRTLSSATVASYDAWLAAHVAAWTKYWAASDVRLDGPDADQLALRYSIYQLLAVAPHDAVAQSIPARGLSGQTYKGAVFWDTEMFMLPFFAATDAATARSLVNYRIQGLAGAKAKAAAYGFRGAFYAWESQEHGLDACSDYNVTDVFTKRPMRTYFKDKQVHISGAVALAIWRTAQWLADDTLLTEGGAAVILACAEFYLDYARQGLLRPSVSIPDVIGPDEYHERVTDNAYTNKVVAATWQCALDVLAHLDAPQREAALAAVGGEDFVALVHTALAHLRRPVEQDGVLEQFAGYFKLEDCSVADVRSRLLDPREYWGGAYGVAAQTQVLKQADVVMMLEEFPQDYSLATHRANYDYYEPRTEHGSSLSWSMYAIEAARLGKGDAALEFFRKTATVDLTGQSKQWAGDIYIGGTHPAANAGAWLVALRGFAGMTTTANRLAFAPHLPADWNAMAFEVAYRNKRFAVRVTHDGATVQELEEA
ncbi:glycosyl hydrolase family 65 protein [Lacticaseibacillus kribbianus]|uniref:glycosyl hydrolase family 65 protein n=1 Tax=Lacticaseibacillus kribbianus TaxID=2926292 RepID=UPI001CD63C71|nr:glycosyl hydrolase family 65 protein [Lacticaseibacillus kribbianus]